MAIPNKSYADYFTHDCDMRNDVKIKALRRRFSHKGYAVWCFLLEALTDSPDFELPFGEIDRELFAADFDVTPEELNDIVNYCLKIKLLQCDDNRLCSATHKQRFADMLDKRERLSAAGRKGNAVRWGMRQEAQGDIATQSGSDSHPIGSNRKVEYSRVEKSSVEESKEEHKRKNFVAPTVEEVSEEVQARGYHLNPEAFVAFYESKGWKVGNSPMKSWKSALVTWETRWKSEHPNYATNRTSAVNLGVGERIEADGRRTYGTGKVTIPQDAPPRPSEKYGWDAAHNDWILI